MEILKYVVVLRHILEKVLYNPGIPVFIILERHYNIVKWYYHMPRVSQLIKGGKKNFFSKFFSILVGVGRNLEKIQQAPMNSWETLGMW